MDKVKLQIGMLIYPNINQLDVTAPAEVFFASKKCDVHMIWKNPEPVITASGLRIIPNYTFYNSPELDILFIPGGPGQIEIMDDAESLAFIIEKTSSAKFIVSVCTGSLILGAAGLLKGYRATCHWMSLNQLAILGATPVNKRVVRDRNRITGAGVSAGIDLALSIIEEIFDAEIAKDVQLSIEYLPCPPYSESAVLTSERINRLTRESEYRQGRRLNATHKAAGYLEHP